MAKSNVAVVAPSIGYRVKGDATGRPVVEWTGPAALSADALGHAEAPLRARERAVAWLAAQLAHGPRKSTDLFVAAAAANIPEKTLRRAKGALRAESHRFVRPDGPEWYWFDPAAPWPADAPFPKPAESW